MKSHCNLELFRQSLENYLIFVLVSCITMKLHLCSSPPRDKFFLMQEVCKWFSFRLLRVLFFRKGPSLPEVLCGCPSSPACCFELRWLPGNSDAAAVSGQLPWHYDELHERHHKVCTSTSYVWFLWRNSDEIHCRKKSLKIFRLWQGSNPCSHFIFFSFVHLISIIFMR